MTKVTMVKGMVPAGCFYCEHFKINPPIVEEPYTCKLGAKNMPNLWNRNYTVASDCPIYAVLQSKQNFSEVRVNDNRTD